MTINPLSETKRMHPPSGHFSEHVQTRADAYVKTHFSICYCSYSRSLRVKHGDVVETQ